MIELAAATAHSTSPASAFFARWIDHSTWAEWSPDTEWVRLDGPLQHGVTGVIKPAGGPKTRFSVSALETDREYTDTSYLPGARLIFQHLALAAEGGTALSASVSMTGPLAWLWAKVMGGGFRESCQADLDRLVALVDARVAAR